MNLSRLLACALSLSAAAAAAAPAPQCQVETLQGGQALNLAETGGKVRYVDFWASWCGPCAQSFPFLNQLHAQFKGQGLEIVGVDLDEDKQDALDFLEKTPAQFTIAWDKAGKCPPLFEVKAMPSSYLIDRKGEIRYVHLGFRAGDKDEILKRVKEVLSEPPKP
jgi:thiol-disulfide isomerase/thioredoxin